MGRRPKYTFLQRRHSDGQQAHQKILKKKKRYSTSLIIREMQIKTAMSYHLTPLKKTIIKNSTNNKS